MTYATEELLKKNWFVQADMSKFMAYIIAAIDQNKSVGQLLDPHDKIHELIEKFNAGKPQQLAVAYVKFVDSTASKSPAS